MDKQILYDDTSPGKQYAMYLNGQFIGHKPTYFDADEELKRLIELSARQSYAALDVTHAAVSVDPSAATADPVNNPYMSAYAVTGPTERLYPLGYPGLLTGDEIKALHLVSPCIDKVSDGKLSYGLEGCGYTLRLAPEIVVFNSLSANVFDPKHVDESDFTTLPLHCDTAPGLADSEIYVLLPPHSFGLASSFESIALPDDIIGLCANKSSYARCGVQWQITPLENGWKGKSITLEWFNSTGRWIKAYVGEGVMQVHFFRANQTPSKSYNGYYQDAPAGISLARVENNND